MFGRGSIVFAFAAFVGFTLTGMMLACNVPPAFGALSPGGETPLSVEDLKINRDPVTGAVTFLRSRRGLESGVGSTALASNPASAVFVFLARYEDLLGMPNAVKELVFQEKKVDTMGMIHIKLQQIHERVPVYGAEVRIHYASDGQTVRVVNGRFIPNLAIDPRPAISWDTAVTIVRSIQPGGVLWGEPQLRIYSGHIDPAVTGDHLAWLVRIFDEQEPSRNLYVVDAHTGEFLTRYNELDTALNRQIYDAGHDRELPGERARFENDPETRDTDTDNAYDFLGDTYNYFFDNFGRDSYKDTDPYSDEDDGAPLVATVHYGTDYRNAFWNGSQMVFGDGFAVDDVTAHELTHAVTAYEADLIYQNQSGALNESFSDIFGEFVDLSNGRGDDRDGVKWLLGEDLPVEAIRSMSDPPKYGDPDKTSEYLCTPDDNGGVHSNSGIPNKAAYLMVEGGEFNGHTIQGIGILRTGQVHYRALTIYLNSSATFRDHYEAMIQSCEDLFEEGKVIDDFDCQQVDQALKAVEMDQEPECGNAWETAYGTLFESRSDLNLLRQYRDQFLSQTRKGRRYTRLLYKHSEEALKVLLDNPELMFDAAYLITVNRDAVSELMAGRRGVIGNTDEVLSFIEAFAKKSPPALRFWANLVRWEMGVRMRRGKPFLGFALEE